MYSVRVGGLVRTAAAANLSGFVPARHFVDHDRGGGSHRLACFVSARYFVGYEWEGGFVTRGWFREPRSVRKRRRAPVRVARCGAATKGEAFRNPRIRSRTATRAAARQGRSRTTKPYRAKASQPPTAIAATTRGPPPLPCNVSVSAASPASLQLSLPRCS